MGRHMGRLHVPLATTRFRPSGTHGGWCHVDQLTAIAARKWGRRGFATRASEPRAVLIAVGYASLMW